MPNIQGTAIAWGTSSTDMTGFTAAVSGGYTFTAEDYNSESDKAEIRDANGDIKSVIYHGARETLSLKCYPSGTSANIASLPVAGETATITSTNAKLAGNWCVESSSSAGKNDGIVEFDISLYRPIGVTIT